MKVIQNAAFQMAIDAMRKGKKVRRGTTGDVLMLANKESPLLDIRVGKPDGPPWRALITHVEARDWQVVE